MIAHRKPLLWPWFWNTTHLEHLLPLSNTLPLKSTLIIWWILYMNIFWCAAAYFSQESPGKRETFFWERVNNGGFFSLSPLNSIVVSCKHCYTRPLFIVAWYIKCVRTKLEDQNCNLPTKQEPSSSKRRGLTDGHGHTGISSSIAAIKKKYNT